jgi:AcrR family transcriptional regulator
MSDEKKVSRRGAFGRAVGEETRRRLLEAASDIFGKDGYVAPSVDDIVRRADTTRATFYKHFDGKYALAVAYFVEEQQSILPYWAELTFRAAKDEHAVVQWLERLFEAHAARGHTFRAFTEMATIELNFREHAVALVDKIIETLGTQIPSFKGASGRAKAVQRRRVAALLLINQIMQEATVARDFFGADPHIVREHLAESFVVFVKKYAKDGFC